VASPFYLLWSKSRIIATKLFMGMGSNQVSQQGPYLFSQHRQCRRYTAENLYPALKAVFRLEVIPALTEAKFRRATYAQCRKSQVK